MKLRYLALVSLMSMVHICNGQTNSPKKDIYNEDFKWSITIPENFENVSAAEWARLQNVGSDAIESTYDTKIENRAKTIFVFKSDQLNYFESNYQPFDSATDGNYVELCKNVNEILYKTFTTQMPGTKIDSTFTTEKINDLEFMAFRMKITYPNQMTMNVLTFSRLFGNKEFTVNMIYVDENKGTLMLNAWKNSTFAKE